MSFAPFPLRAGQVGGRNHHAVEELFFEKYDTHINDSLGSLVIEEASVCSGQCSPAFLGLPAPTVSFQIHQLLPVRRLDYRQARSL